MRYTMTTPCTECPFLRKLDNGFSVRRLEQFARGEFPCHKSAEVTDDGEGTVFTATEESVHCAGALIYLEKRERSHQMMHIVERLGLYDHTKLDMTADVR